MPELAVLLIQDDLDCEPSGARKCIEESSEIGELLHEDTSEGSQRENEEL